MRALRTLNKIWFIAFLLLAIVVAGCGTGNNVEGSDAGGGNSGSGSGGGNPAPTSLPPTLTLTDPANSATNVPINQKISAAFSESMNPATLTNSSFTLTGPGSTPVLGTVTSVGPVAVFTPASNLLSNTAYTATVTTGAQNAAGQSLAANATWSFSTGAGADTTPPTVTLTEPLNSATNVAINQQISAAFSEGMDPTTITGQSFVVTGPNQTPLAGSVTYIGLVAVFAPATDLASSTTYTATITTGAKDLAGNALAANSSWTFTTGAGVDTTPPTVTLTSPVNSATNVAINQQIAVAFSEAMDPTTITNLNFTLTGPNQVPVSGSVLSVGQIATFAPTVNLASATLYKATVSTGVKDLAGNALAANYSWTFTTGAGPDTTAPTVTLTDPVNSATNVATNQQITASFSAAMDPTTINNLNFTLAGPNQINISGTVNSVGQTATFQPTANLAFNTAYTATVSTGAKDLAGNALAANFTWTFTTGAGPDTTAPTVILTDPGSTATNVALNQAVQAAFSVGMDPTTITNQNFTLTGPGLTPVAGTVTSMGQVATFTPTNNLTSSITYTATLTTGAKDLAGNALAANYTWVFTTGAAPATAPPYVTLTDPVNGATNVPLNQKAAATFSVAMDPTTLTNQNFTLTGPGLTPVVGTVTSLGQIATFTPVSNLLASTTYTATITTGAKDLAGIGLANNYSWVFTTGAVVDTTPPTVTATVPLNGATGVPVNQIVTATFSQGMDPTTINNLDFLLTGPGPTPVSGTVTTVGLVSTFTPANNLAVSTLYTATITIGAKDLAGNALAANYVWSFTTGTTGAALQVPLGVISTFGSFGANAGVTNQGLLTVINGDIATTGPSTVITGLYDAEATFTTTPLNAGNVTGTIYTSTNPPGSLIASQGALDAQTAYNQLTPAGLPGGINLGTDQLGGLTLAPGVYESAPGTYSIQGSPLTLDAQGDPNAVWVFQMATSLTVGGPGAAFPQSVLLANGAQAKNVYWQVGSAATINAGGGGTMVGTILAQAGVVFSTAGSVDIATLNGRAIGLNASVTLVNTVINVPAP